MSCIFYSATGLVTIFQAVTENAQGDAQGQTKCLASHAFAAFSGSEFTTPGGK